MSWDTAACFKSLCSAYNDFQQQPCDETVQDLQRQIDVGFVISLYVQSYIKWTFCIVIM